MASSGSFNTSAYGSGDYYRYLTFSWSVASQSVANNTTTINWRLSGGGGSTSAWVYTKNITVKINGQTVYSNAGTVQLYNGTTVATGSYTITHKADGSQSFSAYAEGGIYYYSQMKSGSGSWSLPQIARAATITSAPDFNDEQNPTIKYSNPAGNSVSSLQACISLTGSAADIAYRDIPKTGSSYTFELTDAERNVLRNACTNAKSRTVYFYIQTVIGSNTFRNNVGKTLTIVNANPTLGSFSYADTNSATTTITGDSSKIIQNNSTLVFTAAAATPLKGATISQYTLSFNNATYNRTSAGTYTLTNPNVSSDTTATLTVTDSRGYTSSTSLTVNVLAWAAPYALITMARQQNYYSETDLTVDGHYSSLDNKNTLTIQYQTKKVSDTAYSALTTISNNQETTITLDNQYQWDVRVILTDRLGSTTYNLSLDRGMPLIFFDRLRNSVGVNCFPSYADSLEVNGVPVQRSVMTRALGGNITNPTTNSYTALNLNSEISVGSALIASDNGGIKIGTGVSNILISGRAFFVAGSTTGLRYIAICKNNANNIIGWAYETINATERHILSITPLLVNVKEGDVIYLNYYTTASDDQILMSTYGAVTSLTVETVG